MDGVRDVFKYFFIAAIVSALMLQGIGPINVSAEEQEPVIRIGVVPTAESLELGAEGAFDVVV